MIIGIEHLKPHELVDDARLLEVLDEIREHGVVPILIDAQTRTILDGHHRYHALKRLGYDKVPVREIDYARDDIRVEAWREGEMITKDTVLRCASCGELLAPKTTRHTIECPECEHVSLSELEG